MSNSDAQPENARPREHASPPADTDGIAEGDRGHDGAAVIVEWRGEVTNDEINILHAEAFEHRVLDDDWLTPLETLSLGWVTARDAVGLIGFVNIIWDGGVHAFVEDTAVAVRARRRGIGRRLIEMAREHSTAAGCEWLHVDFDDHLREFYFDACGFAPTNAGLMRLR
ncbi:Acetyltransferase (GNAT) family [Mycobacteroides abscessus subsp. abscessus]|nr:Acetyltransferase (GNAT) family [Mycobacteroides abscessus subsp. abscessus]